MSKSNSTTFSQKQVNRDDVQFNFKFSGLGWKRPLWEKEGIREILRQKKKEQERIRKQQRLEAERKLREELEKANRKDEGDDEEDREASLQGRHSSEERKSKRSSGSTSSSSEESQTIWLVGTESQIMASG
ncbi:hypothetical protein EGW08_008633, partial [Elysia chlorotica]